MNLAKILTVRHLFPSSDKKLPTDLFNILTDLTSENGSIFTTDLFKHLLGKLTITTDYAIEQMNMFMGLTRSSKHTIFSSPKSLKTFFC